MNLSKEIVEEINALLKKEKLDLPVFRTEVDSSGRNVKWLQKAIKKHTGASDRLKELLEIS